MKLSSVSIYSRIENLRIHRDLSWDQTSEILRCNRSYFFHLKAGRKEPSARFIARLARLEEESGIVLSTMDKTPDPKKPAKADEPGPENSMICNYTRRLDRLKAHHCATWGELAQIIGISRSMLDFIRLGQRDAGPKVLRKIRNAEVEAGIVNSTRGVNYSSKTPAKAGISGSGKSIIWKKRVSGELAKIREEMAQWGTRIEALERELQEEGNENEENER